MNNIIQYIQNILFRFLIKRKSNELEKTVEDITKEYLPEDASILLGKVLAEDVNKAENVKSFTKEILETHISHITELKNLNKEDYNVKN